MLTTKPSLALLLFCQACLQSTAYPQQARSLVDARVAGGSTTTIEKFPYVVSIREDLQGNYDVHICGGSVISNWWVLSSGQCLMGDIPEMYAVRAGSADIDKGTKHAVSTIAMYQFQGGDISVNDISLVKVATEFVYSSTVKAVKLVAGGTSFGAGTECTVAGWGPILPEGTSVEVLRVATVPVVSNSECTTAYKTSYHEGTMMCVGHKNTRLGACVNDEGSALIYNGEQIGVVSFTTACFNGTTNAGPGIYTSVSYFRNWIKTQTGV